MTEEEKVGVALRVMPVSIEHSIVRSLRHCKDYEALKDALEDEIHFTKEHKSSPTVQPSTHLVEEEKGPDDDDDDGNIDPSALAAML